jgi:hypothetical protein
MKVKTSRNTQSCWQSSSFLWSVPFAWLVPTLTMHFPQSPAQFSKLSREAEASGGAEAIRGRMVHLRLPGWKAGGNVTAGNQGTLRIVPLHPNLTRSVWERSNATFEREPQIPVSTVLATPRTQIAKRRSIRIALNTPIGLSGHDGQKCPFTMPAKATNLNRHGATIHVARDLSVGSTIMVRNPRGTQVSARVVSRLAASQGVSVYAIEFIEQDEAANNFWGITFPPIASRVAIAEQAGLARRRRGSPSLYS